MKKVIKVGPLEAAELDEAALDTVRGGLGNASVISISGSASVSISGSASISISGSGVVSISTSGTVSVSG